MADNKLMLNELKETADLSLATLTDAVSLLDNIDEAIHQKARLGILSTLMTLGEADFKLLKETLNLSDGNLSTHMTLLENRGYITVRKEFKGKRPHTTITLTNIGRDAFQQYLAALEKIIRAANGGIS